MERRSQPPGQHQRGGRAPNDVVALCKAYSERLKVRETHAVAIYVGEPERNMRVVCF